MTKIGCVSRVYSVRNPISGIILFILYYFRVAMNHVNCFDDINNVILNRNDYSRRIIFKYDEHGFLRGWTCSLLIAIITSYKVKLKRIIGIVVVPKYSLCLRRSTGSLTVIKEIENRCIRYSNTIIYLTTCVPFYEYYNNINNYSVFSATRMSSM